jgi:hypothetical protein
MDTVSPYRDFWMRLIVSILFSLFFIFLGTDSIADIVQGRYFLSDLVSSFLLVFISITYISLLSAYFDRHYAWNNQAATRLVYQLIAGILVPAAFVLGYMYLYLIVFLGFKREEVPFFHTEFPIAVLFIIFWNVVYAGYYFYRENKKSNVELQTLKAQLFTLQNIETGSNALPTLPAHAVAEPVEEPEFTETSSFHKIKILVAVSGNKNIPIPVETIAYFYKDGNYTTLKTFQAETYLLNHSLDELMKLLEETTFFRANRQFIINLKACHYFTNEENGKLAVHLVPAYGDEVIISQKRAPAFKEWLNK